VEAAPRDVKANQVRCGQGLTTLSLCQPDHPLAIMSV
jgi:hypothetical protein